MAKETATASLIIQPSEDGQVVVITCGHFSFGVTRGSLLLSAALTQWASGRLDGIKASMLGRLMAGVIALPFWQQTILDHEPFERDRCAAGLLAASLSIGTRDQVWPELSHEQAMLAMRSFGQHYGAAWDYMASLSKQDNETLVAQWEAMAVRIQAEQGLTNSQVNEDALKYMAQFIRDAFELDAVNTEE